VIVIAVAHSSEGNFGGTMHPVRLGTNTAVFLVFFGVSLLDALTSGNFLRAAFWLAIGFVFLSADRFKPRDRGGAKP
jgi:hypothetical protein